MASKPIVHRAYHSMRTSVLFALLVGACQAPSESPLLVDGSIADAAPIDARPDARPDAPPCVPACDGRECGSDGCGGTCGTCVAPETCGVGGAGVCGCAPKTCTQLGAQCGTVSDGCGSTLTCGTCNAGATCGLLTPNRCCAPTTCAAEGATCGSISDGCGGTLVCGTCTAPATCGGGLDPHTCAVCASGFWDHQLLDTTDNVGEYNAVTADAAGTVHVVYQDWTAQRFYYMRKPLHGTWTRELVSTDDYMGWDSDIVVDTAGGVHITFSGVSFDDLYYGYRSPAGQWKLETIDGNNRGTHNAIAVGADGVVHVSYTAGQPGAGPLTYARRATNGTWTRAAIGVTASDYADTSIVVNPQGAVRVAYADSASGFIKLAQRSTPTSGWTIETIASNASPQYPSMARDAADGLHVAYHRASNDALAYAYKPAGGSWTTWILDTSGTNGTGLWPEIAVDGDARAHIIYYEPYDRVRYATGIHGGSWSYETLDYVSSVGMHSSIAADSQGYVHVTYYESLDQDIEYAALCP